MPDLDPVFERSFTRALGAEIEGKRFVDRFYERFLTSDPQVAAKFSSTHMSRQKTMLHDSLHDLVDYARSAQPPRYLERIAALHRGDRLDIAERLYAVWLRCVVDTAREFDPHFGPRTAAAWRTALEPGISFMLGRDVPRT